MNIILWIVLGAIAGWVASVAMRTQRQSLFADIVLGVLGALVGGFLFNLFGQPGVTGLDIYSLAVSVIGAAVLIALGRMVYGTA